MMGFCPNCDKESNLTRVRKSEVLTIRGEEISVVSEFLRCDECGEEFDDPKSSYDPLVFAYTEYRRRKGMAQPEQIHNFRKKYGLTQKELSGLSGIGIASLSRYENGSLQEEVHDKIIQLVMEPLNLLKMVEEDISVLSDEKKRHLVSLLKSEVEGGSPYLDMFKDVFGRYNADQLSGYKELDAYRLLNMVLFFCDKGIFKTKLNKLLFYTDFKHYKDYAVSISGCRYAHLPYGPVPDNYKAFYAFISQGLESPLEEEEQWCHDCPGEILISRIKPDLSLFSVSELKVLAMVKEFFEDFTATRIKDFSHNEAGYRATNDGDLISYQYAERLQI